MAEALDAAADGGVDAHRSCLQDEAADQIGVDLSGGLDLAARGLLDLLEDPARLLVGEVVGGGQLDVEPAFLGCHQPVEFARDLFDLAYPTLLRGEPEEVSDELIGVAEQVADDPGLRLGVELGVAQNASELRYPAHRRDEVAQLLVDHREAAVLLRGFEQRTRIGAVDDGYVTASCSSTEKSRSLIASSIRRLWSASSSTLPVTFEVATSVNSATSARICWSAR